jgi:hypothetical protein
MRVKLRNQVAAKSVVERTPGQPESQRAGKPESRKKKVFCLVVRLSGSPVVWLSGKSGFPVVWFSGFPAFWRNALSSADFRVTLTPMGNPPPLAIVLVTYTPPDSPPLPWRGRGWVGGEEVTTPLLKVLDLSL